MLRMDISTLRLPELRSLLAKARARSQDALAEQIEAEIAGRAGSRRAKPPPALEADEVLPIDPGVSEFELDLSEADAALAFEADEALDFGAAPDDFVFQLPKADPPPAHRWPIGVAIAGVLVAGAAVAWGLNDARLPGQAPPAAPTVVAAAPSPAPRAMTVRSDTVAPPAPVETKTPEPPTVVAKAEPAPAPPSRLDPCATPPSPADRLLCNDLALNLLDHEMREAYGRAMEAGADPVALRQSQAAWRRARDPTGEPRALADLYDRRIRELEAAAEPPPTP